MLLSQKRPFWRTLNFLVFIILLIFSIFSFTSKGTVKLGIIRTTSTIVLFPIEKSISFITNLFALHRQNTQLRKEIAAISLEIQRCANIRQENAIFRNLYGFKPMANFDLVPCEIIGKNPGLYNKSLIIDRGENDGIEKNMPVIAAGGLVGKVIETSKITSEMLTLYNRNTLISAMNLRSRVQGIIRWSNSQYLMLDDVPLHSDVMIGDTIITSGMGGIYPKGIFIGIIQNVGESPKEIVMTIKINPFVDISLLEEVFVIKEEKTTPVPSDSDEKREFKAVSPAMHLDVLEPIKDPSRFGTSAFEKKEKTGKYAPGVQ